MKNLFYLLIAFMLTIAYVQYESRDGMAALQAKAEAVGAYYKAKSIKKNRCVIENHNGLTLRICQQ